MDKGIRQKIHKRVNSFTDGSAFCPGATKRVPSDSAKHLHVYTSSNICHSHEWRVDTASGKTLKTECVFTRCPTGGQKKIACIHGLRSEGVKKVFFAQYVYVLYTYLHLCASIKSITNSPPTYHFCGHVIGNATFILFGPMVYYPFNKAIRGVFSRPWWETCLGFSHWLSVCGCAAMTSLFWPNVNWCLWSVTLGFQMADCKK